MNNIHKILLYVCLKKIAFMIITLPYYTEMLTFWFIYIKYINCLHLCLEIKLNN